MMPAIPMSTWGVWEVPRYRARGDMKGTEWPVTRAEVFQGWLQEILTPQQIDGMVTTNQSLLALVEAGRINGDQAVAVSLKPNELAQALRGRS